MKPKITLRHIGIIVSDLEKSKEAYEMMGFEEIHRESFRVIKMRDKEGLIFELIEGEFHGHVCVNFYETESGQYLEVFKHDPKQGG